MGGQSQGYILRHLVEDRGVDLTLYPVHVDEAEGVVTFPLWNLSGQMVGYQQYRPSASKDKKNHPRTGRYYTYVTPESENTRYLAVWGLETLSFRSDVLFVLEGTFKCVPFHRRRLPAVATMSNNPKQLRNWLFLVSRSRRVVVVGDNDGSGSATRSLGYDMVFPPKGFKDVDDLDDEGFDRWLEEIRIELDLPV